MVKRPSEKLVDDGEQAYLKRQKITHAPASVEEVQSVRHLQQLLAFDQDVGRAKHGIQSFKNFLETALDEGSKRIRLPILKEYLELQLPRDQDDKDSIYLSDIIQTWSFASKSNNDALLSAVPALLALLLKVLSGELELLQHGLRLCRTLLQNSQLELLARGLSSNKARQYVISPCLRLLREVSIFDGGSLAREIFRGRDSTLKALARNLGLRHVGDGPEDYKKPSVRSHALRFFLSLMKFLPVEAKKELVSMRDVVPSVTRDISGDPPYLVRELLDGLREQILRDELLPKDIKSRFLNPVTLGRIASLYGYEHQEDHLKAGQKSINLLAHEFLLVTCTAPNIGVLYQRAGFYPPGIDPDGDFESSDLDFIDLGLQSLDWSDRFAERSPVRNKILSEFIQSLRPWSDTKQAELLMEIFKAAPELIADYFFNKKSFTFEPKLTATWIGYSAFLFSAVMLPIPPFFGHQLKYARMPPPSSIVIESILPQPLTQKALTRCLNQSSPLIRFFAIRLLVIAFQKLESTLIEYHKASKSGSRIWSQAAGQLKELFCQRCPSMKDVIITFSNIPGTNMIQRQAASKLLVLYYETIPQVALESKFDISSRLAETLDLLEVTSTGPEDRVMRFLELENLYQIAHYSPGMRWFNKVDSIDVSPFTAMLRLSARSSSEASLSKIRSIIDSVILESGIMQTITPQPAQDALIVALSISDAERPVYEFLDNCFLRCSTTPVKYIDILEKYSDAAYSGKVNENDTYKAPVSLLLVAIAEQWPYTAKSSKKEIIGVIVAFIAHYIAASIKVHEDQKIIKLIVKDLVAHLPEGSSAQKKIERYQKLANSIELPEARKASTTSHDSDIGQKAASNEIGDSEDVLNMTTDFDSKGGEADYTALTRWVSKDLAKVIEEGHASALIMLLSSSHLDIRKEALSNIAKLAFKLKESSYDEREQIWVLLCEVMETAKPHIDKKPLPSTILAFASQAVSVLSNPLHSLYPKTNKFLSQGPAWEIDKLPLMHSILNEPPTLDDAHYQEIKFLLIYLTSGLCTPDDMTIFHNRRVFERLLSLYNNLYIAKGLKEKILALLWKATSIEGGCATLISRFSILSWLQAQMKYEEGDKRLKPLMEKVLKFCDGERLKAWSGQSKEYFLQAL